MFFFLASSTILRYGSDYWSSERHCMNKITVSGRSLGQPLPILLDRFFNSCLVNWFGTFLRSPVSSASFVSITAVPTIQWLGLLQYMQTQHQKWPFFLKARFGVFERLKWTSDLGPHSCLRKTLSDVNEPKPSSLRSCDLTSISTIFCGSWGTVWLRESFVCKQYPATFAHFA